MFRSLECSIRVIWFEFAMVSDGLLVSSFDEHGSGCVTFLHYHADNLVVTIYFYSTRCSRNCYLMLGA